MDDLIPRGLKARKESKYIEFKDELDVDSSQAWCEIIKDIVALSNSGGGIILIGLNNRGEPTGFDTSRIIELDPAKITDKIFKYTGIQFSEFEIIGEIKNKKSIALIRVFPRFTPIVFIKPGTYSIEGSKQKTAFSQGAVYFRHRAKSEPGSTDDLRERINLRIEEVRNELLENVQKVIETPPGYTVRVLPQEIIETEDPSTSPIRLVDDPDAPAYRKLDPDITHPYRQKEVISEVKKRLPKNVRFNSHDILCIRRVFDIDSDIKFCHCPKFSTNQYSSNFIEWIVSKYEEDTDFFQSARVAYRTSLRNDA